MQSVAKLLPESISEISTDFERQKYVDSASDSPKLSEFGQEFQEQINRLDETVSGAYIDPSVVSGNDQPSEWQQLSAGQLRQLAEETSMLDTNQDQLSEVDGDQLDQLISVVESSEQLLREQISNKTHHDTTHHNTDSLTQLNDTDGLTQLNNTDGLTPLNNTDGFDTQIGEVSVEVDNQELFGMGAHFGFDRNIKLTGESPPVIDNQKQEGLDAGKMLPSELTDDMYVKPMKVEMHVKPMELVEKTLNDQPMSSNYQKINGQQTPDILSEDVDMVLETDLEQPVKSNVSLESQIEGIASSAESKQSKSIPANSTFSEQEMTSEAHQQMLRQQEELLAVNRHSLAMAQQNELGMQSQDKPNTNNVLGQTVASKINGDGKGQLDLEKSLQLNELEHQLSDEQSQSEQNQQSDQTFEQLISTSLPNDATATKLKTATQFTQTLQQYMAENVNKTTGNQSISSAQSADKAQMQLNETLQMNGPDVAVNVKERITLMLNRGVPTADIRLDPAELGQMQVKMQVENDVTSVNFVVQNSQAKELLEQAMPKLRDMLAEQGVEMGDSSVSQQNKQQQGSERDGESSQGSAVEQEHGDEDENSSLLVQQVNITNGAVGGIDYFA